MYKKTEPSLFEIDELFPGILPENDWSYIFSKEIYPLIDEAKFRHLFQEKKGRPNRSIKIQICLLIFMAMEKLNWRESEYLFQRRLDWWVATRSCLGNIPVDFTTLFRFYDRLMQDDIAKKLFDVITSKFIELCGTSLKKQRIDSFFVHGWLQILSRYGLFKETLKNFLQSLRKHKLELYESIIKKLSKNYLEKEFDLTEKDRDKAHHQIKLMANDLFLITNLFAVHKQIKHYESFKTLRKVFEQQCQVVSLENEDEPDSIDIIIREKPQGDDIISTPYNTDARYVKKGKQKVCGHKAFITETCDKNNKTQFLVDVELTPSTKADSNELIKIEERLEKSNFKPKELYGDAGFVNGKTIIGSKEKGISLEGPSSGRSQSFEAFNAKDRPFDVTDFDIKIDIGINKLIVLSCPAHQFPIEQSRSNKTNKILVHFDVGVCKTCKLKGRCPVKIQKTIATLNIDEKMYVGAFRHHKYMENTEYRKKCAIRAGIEATVSEMVRAHGLRKSRHTNEKRTRLQLIFGAIACNVKRFIKHGNSEYPAFLYRTMAKSTPKSELCLSFFT